MKFVSYFSEFKSILYKILNFASIWIYSEIRNWFKATWVGSARPACTQCRTQPRAAPDGPEAAASALGVLTRDDDADGGCTGNEDRLPAARCRLDDNSTREKTARSLCGVWRIDDQTIRDLTLCWEFCSVRHSKMQYEHRNKFLYRL
jgi:hypothetical protein